MKFCRGACGGERGEFLHSDVGLKGSIGNRDVPGRLEKKIISPDNVEIRHGNIFLGGWNLDWCYHL